MVSSDFVTHPTLSTYSGTRINESNKAGGTTESEVPYRLRQGYGASRLVQAGVPRQTWIDMINRREEHNRFAKTHVCLARKSVSLSMGSALNAAQCMIESPQILAHTSNICEFDATRVA